MAETPKRYRVRPPEVEAMVWPGTALAAWPIIEWVRGQGGQADYSEGYVEDGVQYERIKVTTTTGGYQIARPGDVVMYASGRFSVCKVDTLARVYEEVPNA